MRAALSLEWNTRPRGMRTDEDVDRLEDLLTELGGEHVRTE